MKVIGVLLGNEGRRSFECSRAGFAFFKIGILEGRRLLHLILGRLSELLQSSSFNSKFKSNGSGLNKITKKIFLIQNIYFMTMLYFRTCNCYLALSLLINYIFAHVY